MNILWILNSSYNGSTRTSKWGGGGGKLGAMWSYFGGSHEQWQAKKKNVLMFSKGLYNVQSKLAIVFIFVLCYTSVTSFVNSFEKCENKLNWTVKKKYVLTVERRGCSFIGAIGGKSNFFFFFFFFWGGEEQIPLHPPPHAHTYTHHY